MTASRCTLYRAVDCARRHAGETALRRPRRQTRLLRDLAARAVVGPACARCRARRGCRPSAPSSTTTRWRKPPRTIATAACSSDHSGLANTSSEVRCSATSSVSGSSPLPIEIRTSRSVMMPGPIARGPGRPPRRPAGRPSAPTPGGACVRVRPSGPGCSCPPAPASRLPLPGRWLATIGTSLPGRADGCATVPSGTSADAPSAGDCTGTHSSRRAPPARKTSHVPTQRPATVAAPLEPLRGRRRDRRPRVRVTTSRSTTSPAASPPRGASSSAPIAEIGNTTFRDHLTAVRMERAGRAARPPQRDGPRGRAPRRLPPARPVRQGVPAPPRRRAVGLPRPARAARAARDARRLAPQRPSAAPAPRGAIGSLRPGDFGNLPRPWVGRADGEARRRTTGARRGADASQAAAGHRR